MFGVLPPGVAAGDALEEAIRVVIGNSHTNLSNHEIARGIVAIASFLESFPEALKTPHGRVMYAVAVISLILKMTDPRTLNEQEDPLEEGQDHRCSLARFARDLFNVAKSAEEVDGVSPEEKAAIATIDPGSVDRIIEDVHPSDIKIAMHYANLAFRECSQRAVPRIVISPGLQKISVYCVTAATSVSVFCKKIREWLKDMRCYAPESYSFVDTEDWAQISEATQGPMRSFAPVLVFKRE